MSSGIGQLIEANDYVSIKALINPILGIGSGQSGYGQNVVSTNSTTGEIIPHTKWVELRGDMIRCRQHQKGVSVGSTTAIDGLNLVIPDSSTTITETIRNQYALFAADVVSDKLLVADNQLINETLVSTQRTTKWNGTVTHTITVTGSILGHGSAENLRYFFNAGGRLRFSASRIGGSAKAKNTNWTTILSNMGEIVFDYNHTSPTGTGSGSSIGWYGLTTNDQLIFQQYGTGDFSTNRYQIFAKKSLDGNSIIFSVMFADNYTTIPDFNIDGTLTSTLTQDRPNTTNVSIYTNTATDSGLPTTGTTVPQYEIYPSLTSMNEGATITFTVNTEFVTNGTTLYWTTVGNVNQNRFSDNTLQGTVIINGNTGTITRTVINDFITDGSTYFALQLRVGSYSGTIMNSSDTVVVNDTSIETYSITPNTYSIFETETVVFTVNTQGVPNGTTLYWTIVGTVSANDFTDGLASGSFIINNNVGTISRTALGDMVVESNETLVLQIRTGSITGPIKATSAPIFVKDAMFSIIPNIINVNEGNAVTFNISTIGVSDGALVYWSTIGTAANNYRFSDNVTQGTVTINGNAGTLVRTLANDNITDGTTDFAIQLKTISQSGSIVATSSNVAVNDTSVEVYNITPNKTSINETESVIFTISTLGVPNGTTLYWSTYGSITNPVRFSDNVSSGSFVVNSNSASLTRTLIGDMIVEGNGNFAIQVRTGSISGPIMTMSSYVTVLDATFTIAPNTVNINEGGSVTFGINTTGVPNGTTMYWTTSGNVSANRFTDGVLTGSVIINNNTGSIVRSITNDYFINGSTSFALQLRISTVNGTIATSSSHITVNDTSIPTCSVVPDSTLNSEGQTITFIVNSLGITNGTTLYWKVVGTVSGYDFSDNSLQGSVVINNNAGVFTRYVATDAYNEGIKYFTIQMFSDAGFNKAIGIGSATVYLRANGKVTINSGTSWTVPADVYNLYVTYPTINGIVGTNYVVTPGQIIPVSIGNFGQASTFGTINSGVFDKQIASFSGNVDNDLNSFYGVVNSTGSTYSGSGGTGTLYYGAAANGCYYNESNEGWHGDLGASISITPVKSNTIIGNVQCYFTYASGRGSLWISQQPTASNNYILETTIYDGGRSEGWYGYTVNLRQQVPFTITWN